jgi:ABC-2 type transport system permease protein
MKYLVIAKNTLQEYFVYRINFVFWRLQVFVTFIIFYSLWATVGESRGGIGNYNPSQLYTYFMVGYVLRALVFTTRTADIGGDIQNGNLSTLLLKPIGTIKYYFSRDLVDKIFNLGFMLIEILILLFMFRPQFIYPTFQNFLLFLVSTILATMLFFNYSLIVSFATFWVDNAWSSRFLFGVVFANLFTGQYIPLDLLPPTITKLLDYTPFPYLYYYPLKIWINHYDSISISNQILSGLLLNIVIYFIAQLLWRSGIRRFQSYGN